MSAGKIAFIALVLGLGFGNFLLLRANMKAGDWRTTILMVALASPVMMFLAWFVVQRMQPALPGLGGWSFSALSDIFILIPVFVALAIGLKRYWAEVPAFFKGPVWMIGAYLVGLGLGLVFHFVLGGRSDSNSPVLSERLHDSATSWTHNVGVFPAVAGALIWALVSLLATSSGRAFGLIVLAVVIVGWGGMVMLDMWRATLDPSHPLHFNPQWLDCEMNRSGWGPRYLAG